MQNKSIVIFALFIFHYTIGQTNLVPNPSFEIDTACPRNDGEVFKAFPWKGTNNSSELYNECANLYGLGIPSNSSGYQKSRTGKSYAGQWSFQYYGLNYREYIQSPLSQSLVPNSCYLVKFYVNKANNLKLACNNHGALLTSNSFTSPTVQPPTPAPMVNYTPQILSYNNAIVKDTLNWTEIGAVFKAGGGEKYITLGNFKPDSLTDTISFGKYYYNMSYYYYDDVSVEEITNTKKWTRDTIIHIGDSAFIGSNLGGISATWYNMSGQQISNKPGLFVKPNIDTKYIAHQTFCGNTYIDTIMVQIIEDHVGLNKLRIKNEELKIGVSGSDLFIQTNATYGFNIKLINLYGETVYEKMHCFGNMNVKLNDVENGIYFISVESEHGVSQNKILFFKE